MERWKTISRQDPEFLAYLDGTFSDSHRALPVRSLNVDTSREEVTFAIIPLKEIARPKRWLLAWRATRPASLVLSIGPVMVSWLYARSTGFTLQPRLALAAFFGIVFFHVAINILDDYFDHRKGRDRVNPRAGSRMIQNGFVRARTMLVVGMALAGLAILCGLPVVLESPVFILVIALIALAAGLGFSSDRVRLKYRGLGEVTTFSLFGPLLTAGFAWAASGRISLEFLILGSAFGFITVIYYHLKNIENIMVDSQANVRTLATRLGFDSAKRLVWYLAGFSSLSILCFEWATDAHGVFVLAALAQGAVLTPLVRRLARVQSPLSSEMSAIRRRGLVVHWATTLALALGILA